ncbi:MAG: VIT1/CCC1 transporter family protein [Chloroflexi bacterium]|nr:VIT1/CCC1 transporter family protein [Chloroflexota bacterium]
MAQTISRTDRNLWSAFIGEAKTNHLYLAYAIRAMEEGHPEVAQVFMEAAGGETIHALNHLKTIGEVKSTGENLQAVTQGEAYEIATMYPRMIREAEAEGRPEAARSFRVAWERESHHLKLFEDALRQLGHPRAPEPSQRAPASQRPVMTPPSASEKVVAEVSQERTRLASLGRIREVVFGMQDGLISTAALVSSIFGAVTENFLVVLAGLSAALAGMISMAAGSYLSSKAEREVQEAEIRGEARELEAHPAEELAELIEVYRQEGFAYEEATQMAERVSADRQLWLKTMVEKELGLSLELPGSPWKDALTMGVSFIIAAMIPVLPYFFLRGLPALATSLSAVAVTLVAIGVGKTRWTQRNPFLSGLEMLGIGLASALLGYLLGTRLPGLLGIPAVGG